MKKILLILTICLSSLIGLSQDIQKDSIYLSEATVNVFRAENKEPVTFTDIKQNELIKVNIGQEPAAILQLSPSITMHSDGGNNFGYSYFRIRGIDQSRINVTMDGIPLNEPEDQGVYFNNYPDFFNSVESVQIQRGVGLSTNGIPSYGGSINVTSPNLFGESSQRYGFNYGSFNTNRIFGEYKTGLLDNGIGAYIRFSSINTDGYIENAFHNGRSVFYGVGKKWKNSSLKLIGFTGNQQNGMAWAGATREMINENPRSNGNTTEEVDDFTNSVTSIQFEHLGKKTLIKSAIYYNYLDGNYDIFFGPDSISGGDEYQNLALKHHYYGAYVNATSYIGNLTATYGINANQFQRTHTGDFRLNTLTDFTNTGYRNTASAFVKLKYDIDKFTLFGDIQKRYSSFEYQGDVYMDKKEWDFINFKAGINYQLNEKINFYYSYSEAGREPTRQDLFAGESNLSELIDVSPEFVKNHEIGTRYKSDRLTFSLNGYLMNFINEITFLGEIGSNGLPISENIESSYRMGIEFDLAYKASDNFSIYFNTVKHRNIIKIDNSGETITINHPLTPVSKYPISNSPIMDFAFLLMGPLSNISFEYKTGNFTFTPMLRHQGGMYLDIENTEFLEGFTVINLLTSYEKNNSTITLGLNNITNERYAAFGQRDFFNEFRYFQQAGFNFYLSYVVNIK